MSKNNWFRVAEGEDIEFSKFDDWDKEVRHTLNMPQINNMAHM